MLYYHSLHTLLFVCLQTCMHDRTALLAVKQCHQLSSDELTLALGAICLKS